MTFESSTGGKVAFGAEALKVLMSFAQHDESTPESGGVLLGRMIEGTMDIVVDQAAGPSAGDRQRRYFFFRSRKPSQVIVNNAWVSSSGTRNYLGEWHTHPEARPTPSCVDLRNWKRIAKKAKYESPLLIFAIVGTEEIRVWEVTQQNPDPRLLVVR